MAFSKIERRLKIKKRIRKNMAGSAEKPRLSVFRSNKQISVQIIDDLSGRTIVAASSLVKDISSQSGNKTEKAALVGKLIAEKALSAGVSSKWCSTVTVTCIMEGLNNWPRLLGKPVLNSNDYGRKYQTSKIK
jgi:large subunit ribosomal protein L18